MNTQFLKNSGKTAQTPLLASEQEGSHPKTHTLVDTYIELTEKINDINKIIDQLPDEIKFTDIHTGMTGGVLKLRRASVDLCDYLFKTSKPVK